MFSGRVYSCVQRHSHTIYCFSCFKFVFAGTAIRLVTCKVSVQQKSGNRMRKWQRQTSLKKCNLTSYQTEHDLKLLLSLCSNNNDDEASRLNICQVVSLQCCLSAVETINQPSNRKLDKKKFDSLINMMSSTVWNTSPVAGHVMALVLQHIPPNTATYSMQQLYKKKKKLQIVGNLSFKCSK